MDEDRKLSRLGLAIGSNWIDWGSSVPNLITFATSSRSKEKKPAE